MQSAYRYLLAVLFFLQASVSFATHLMGGEITWDCLGNGRYKFFMTLYRDCSDPTQFQIQFNNPGFGIRVHNHPSVSFIAMTLVSRQDIMPDCNILGPPASCDLQSPGSVEEHIFQSQEIQLQGVPPAQGWIFTYSDCCRNTDIFNIDASGAVGMTLRAKMFAYLGANNSPCTDSSPRFEAKPVTVICRSPAPPNQQLFAYNQNASDPDRDSVSYSFATPLDFLDPADPFTTTNPVALVFNPTMSVTSPFPGQTTPGFPNSIAPTLDPVSGQITLSVTGIGKFVSVVRVQSFRCGQLIAEVFREIQLISRACANNDLPSYVPPPELNTTPVDNLYSITATAGDLVQFSITATDNVINNLGGNLFLEASGGAFGSLYSDPNIGCNFPPCATLNPPPPTSGLETLTTIFTWQTACDHVMDVTSPPSIIDEECYTNQTYNTFQISFRDDFCPYPAYTNITINVIVEAPPLTPSPELRCLEVLPGPGGDVKLTWVPPTDPENQFEAYRIFRSSNAAGPFTEIASINSIAQTSYIDLAAGANTAPVYYYISTLTGCAGNILNTPLDTLGTMFIDFSADALGSIDVYWSELSAPLPTSAQLPYDLFKATNSPAPAYSLFSSPNLPEEQDAVSGCDQFVSYYVRLNDQSGCYSLSNVDSGRISTTAPPLAPVLDTVSVNPANNDVLIAWLPDTSPLADSIIIYRLNAGIWTKIDSTHHSDLSRVLTTQGPDVQSISYRITSRDLCKIEGPPSAEHETLHLSYELNQCDASVKLICNPYTAWQNDPVIYHVFSSENAGPLQELGTFAGTGTLFPQVRISGLLTGINYCYFIRAENNANGKTSSSNEVCFNAAVDVPPDYTYVRTATVNPSGSVFTACLLDPTADINFYAVQRSNWPGSALETLVTLPVIPGTPEVVFLDTTVNSTAQSYVYKFVVYNKCNEVSGISNPARTILLQGKADDGFVNRLLWNTYGEWDAQVFDYTVYRALGIEGNFEPIENTVTDTSYIDRVVDEVESNLTFCYIIKAYEGPGNSYGVRDSSWSNIVCLTQQSTFYIPNAFVPGRNGANMIYKPKGLFESLSTNFKFSIYNRWGEQIFYTENPSEGWDGTYQSRQVNPDIFAVRITFQLPDGTEFKHTGSVLLLN